jgi:multidrug efflux pump subunit AcrB
LRVRIGARLGGRDAVERALAEALRMPAALSLEHVGEQRGDGRPGAGQHADDEADEAAAQQELTLSAAARQAATAVSREIDVVRLSTLLAARTDTLASVAAVDGDEVILVAVRKRAGANTVAILEALERELPRLESSLPRGLTLRLVRSEA